MIWKTEDKDFNLNGGLIDYLLSIGREKRWVFRYMSLGVSV
jgi:hypothetical protein